MSGPVSEQFGVQASNTTMVGGALSGLVAWLMSIDWLGLLGASIAIIGLVGNFYFQLRRDKRETRESEARLKSLESKSVGQG